MPPVAPWSTSRRKAGDSRCSSSALAPPSHRRAVSAPMRGAQRGVAHDDEDEGLAVLRARRVGRRGQDPGDGGVVDVVGEERPGGPLGVDHVEEVRHELVSRRRGSWGGERYPGRVPTWGSRVRAGGSRAGPGES